MKINYVTLADERLPAYRYRMKMIGEYLGDYEITKVPVEADIYVFSKPYHENEDLLSGYLNIARRKKFVFDLCDDVFVRGGPVPEYTRRMVNIAQAVTVPTWKMADRVKEETGIDAVVISDPCEFPERPIKDISDPKIMWFGTSTNLITLNFMEFPYSVEVVTVDRPDIREWLNALPYETRFTEWSHKNMEEAFERNNIVIIPSTLSKKRQVKSVNRVAESIRSGLSVVAAPLPSYLQFDKYISMDWDIREGLKNIKQTTPEAQKYVSDNFDISVIGEKWKKLFSKLNSTSDVGVDSLMVG